MGAWEHGIMLHKKETPHVIAAYHWSKLAIKTVSETVL